MDRLELRSGQYLTLDEDKVDPSCTFEELSLSGVVEFAVEGTAKQPPSCTTLLAGMEPATLLSKEMWNSHGSATGCHCGGTPPEPAECMVGVDPGVFARRIQADGYYQTGQVVSCPASCEQLVKQMAYLNSEMKLPPCFIYMFDEAWGLVREVWRHVERMLGHPVLLEPSVAAFKLDAKDSTNKSPGRNFPLPHRDYSYAECCRPDGSPKMLSVWVPLTQVTAENGCMFVVPREFDRQFDQDTAWEHMRPAHIEHKTSYYLARTTCLTFPLDGIRPLTGPAGSINCWLGNTVHWGGSCQRSALDHGVPPRASLALVFRAVSSETDALTSSLLLSYEASKDLSVGQRLEYVQHSLHAFSHWYKLPSSLVSLFSK
eukprot:TRINITY_DN37443_c0_g1_i2.p1 TRINITY_DN37443_c0_g1~~TRINITY_DN37443_c0_g1_i2.p1  ORF type:complete len:373 (+),score=47.14 TRINITY_DN37443_c0_g1_i2:168-1286(+)